MDKILGYTRSSVKNFFKNTLELDSTESDTKEIEDIYTTMISLHHEENRYNFYISLQAPLLHLFAMQLLMEENPDQDTLIDILNENANLIIGTAKVLWEEDEHLVPLTLGTPEYQGFFEKNFSKEFDEKLYFQAAGDVIMIGVEKVKETTTV